LSLLGAIPTLATDKNAPLAMLTGADEDTGGLLVELAPGHWVRQAQRNAVRPSPGN
jgi:hypothetical protein